MPLILKNAPNVKFREISNIFIASFDRPSFAEMQRPSKMAPALSKKSQGTTEETTIKERRPAEKNNS
jgi:hypothetical protein